MLNIEAAMFEHVRIFRFVGLSGFFFLVCVFFLNTVVSTCKWIQLQGPVSRIFNENVSAGSSEHTAVFYGKFSRYRHLQVKVELHCDDTFMAV